MTTTFEQLDRLNEERRNWADIAAKREADNAKLRALVEELAGALHAFLRAPSIGSSGPGSISIEVQEFNIRAARAALARAKEGSGT